MSSPPPVARRLFVDAIEDGTARVLFGEEAFSVPAALLPANAREGSWIEITLATVAAPDDGTEELRRALGRDDPGGDIKL